MALENSDLLVVQRPGTSDLYKLAIGDLPTGDGIAGNSSVIISEDAPATPSDGELWWCESDAVEGGGRLYIYTGSEWVDISQPGGSEGDGASVTVSEDAPVGATEGDLWYSNSTDLEFGGRLYIYIDGVWVDASLPGIGSGDGDGGSANITVSETPPSAEQGSLWWANNTVDEGGGRLYIYIDGQWVDTSLPGGGGFSGDYNDLTNKPNIPPEFNLDDGSVTNDIIHWAELGSVQAISTAETGLTSSGNGFSNIPATGGSGTGLVCNVIRRRNTGAHEVYVAVRGENYNAGDTVFLDLGYDPTNPTGSTGINCTIDQVNETVDGWVARPGEDYYVSSTNDSVNTGVPQFMSGLVTGGDANTLANQSSAATLNVYPIGDKTDCVLHFEGNHLKNNFYSSGTAGGSQINHTMYEAGTGTAWSQLRQRSDIIEFADYYGDDRNIIFRATRNSNNYGEVRIFNNYVSNSARLLRLASTEVVSQGASNTALNFGSTNGKYNFRKVDGTTGYTINAENGNAGFVLPEDAALASNYDAEGEYIGPVQDRVADLAVRVSAIESNEISDDAIDSALLTLVAALTTRLDERDAQIADLTARLTALEGGTN